MKTSKEEIPYLPKLKLKISKIQSKNLLQINNNRMKISKTSTKRNYSLKYTLKNKAKIFKMNKAKMSRTTKAQFQSNAMIISLSN
jgi:hypothetical protein